MADVASVADEQQAASGLLLDVEELPQAVDRGKASGSATDDDDGQD
jgi:hypothetical protein